MSEMIPVVNPTMELSECRDRWTWDETYGCWCLEDVLYTPRAAVPKFQRLSIFAPAGCMNPDGTRQMPASRTTANPYSVV